MTVARIAIAALALALGGCPGDTRTAPDIEQLTDVTQPDVSDPDTNEGDLATDGAADTVESDDSVMDTSRDTVTDTVSDTGADTAVDTAIDSASDTTPDLPLDPDSVEALWGPTRVAFDPRCARCEQLSENTAAHGLGEVVRLIDRAVDDPLTRWGECLDSVFDCARAGGELLACVEASTCPVLCIERYTAGVAGIDERLERFAAFDALFIAEGGACAIPPPPLAGEEGAR